MNRRSFLTGASGVACAAVLSARIAGASEPDGAEAVPGRNILVIITDELSAGVASASMGREHLHTPNIDKLIATGISYERAYSANPICVPSRSAMLSGRYPTQSGVIDNSNFLAEASMPPASPPLGRIFRDQGYDTAYFGKWHVNPAPDLEGLHGFRRMAATLNEDNAAIGGAIDYLREKSGKPGKPFLLVVSILDPHSICEWARGEPLPLGDLPEPPPPDKCPPPPRNLAPQAGEPDALALARRSYHAAKQFPVGDFTADRWRQYRWAYYRLVERADRRIGELLAALSAAGLEKDTDIVFTSDHGDAQGAHGWNQKTVFYEESVRVPFVISRTGEKARASNRLVNVGIDLIPTLCDLAGIAAPKALPGLSVRRADVEPRQYVVASNRLSQGAAIDGAIPKPDGRMLRSARFKYCAYSIGERRESLVDLERDPLEMVNLAGDRRHAGVLDQHRAMLAQWCRETGDTFPVPAGPPPARSR